jgi:exopolysaccharide production protein ExoF
MAKMIATFVTNTVKIGVFAIGLLCVGLVTSLPLIEFANRRLGEGRSMEAIPPMIGMGVLAAAPDAMIDATPQVEPVLPRSAAGTGSFRYAIGDRLKITFYEQLVGEADRSGRVRGQSLIERTELTSEYVVQLNGEVFLPIIGAVPVAQSTPAEAEAALVARARAATGERLKVSVVVTDREPVYVMGALARAGVYKYTPGMVVAQVVAMAGGDTSATDSTWQQFDMAREHERMRKAVERIKRSHAVINVLIAEQRNDRPQPSQRLTELAGTSASELVEVAQQARELERARLQLQVTSLDRLVAATRAELASSRSRLDQVASIVRERTRRRDDLAARFSQGVSTENLIVQARNELAEVQSSFHEVRSAVARTEIRILELERDRDQVVLTAQIDREQQLRTARQTVAEDEIMLSSIAPLLVRNGAVGLLGGSASQVSYKLVRRTDIGPVQLVAEALTPLEPGDVLQVVRSRQETAEAIAR